MLTKMFTLTLGSDTIAQPMLPLTCDHSAHFAEAERYPEVLVLGPR